MLSKILMWILARTRASGYLLHIAHVIIKLLNLRRSRKENNCNNNWRSEVDMVEDDAQKANAPWPRLIGGRTVGLLSLS